MYINFVSISFVMHRVMPRRVLIVYSQKNATKFRHPLNVFALFKPASCSDWFPTNDTNRNINTVPSCTMHKLCTHSDHVGYN